MKLNIRVGIMLALLAAGASAQTMYRCGSVYQDRPCAAGEKGKAVGSSGSAPAAAAAGGGNAECAQRGKDSLKIVWSREGGATQERLLADAKTDAERRLIQDVWRRAGAASTVQAAVERDCLVEVEKRERAAALAAEAARARSEAGPAADPQQAAPARQYVGDPQAGARAQREKEARDAERKKATCERLNASMDSVRARERAGGSAAALESLNEERRRLWDDLRKAGC